MGGRTVTKLLKMRERGDIPPSCKLGDMCLLLTVAGKLYDGDDFIEAREWKPTYPEIAALCGYTDTKSVVQHVKHLVSAGLMECISTDETYKGAKRYRFRLPLDEYVSQRSRPEPAAAGSALPRDTERPEERSARKGRGALAGMDKHQRGLLRYLAGKLLAHWNAGRDGEPKPADIESIACELAKKGMTGNGLDANGVLQACAEALDERVGKAENPVALVRSKVRGFEMGPIGEAGNRLMAEIFANRNREGTVK